MVAAPQRPRVQVVVEVTLEQLAGFEPAPIPLSAWTAALGAPVNDKIAQLKRKGVDDSEAQQAALGAVEDA